MAELTIIHTCDLHGRLSPGAAGKLRELKEQLGAVLLDGGDAFQLPNVLAVPWKLAMAEYMAMAGYDAMGLGNREYFFRARGIGWLKRSVPFPMVATNIDAPVHAGLNKWARITTPSGEVCVLALAREMIPSSSALAWASDVKWLEPVQCLGQIINKVREWADWVVLLSHLGVKADIGIAAQLQGIDLVLGSHDHVLTTQPVIAKQTPMVYSGWGGRWATIVRLRPGGADIDVEVVSLR